MPELTPTLSQAAGEGSGVVTTQQPRTSVSPQQVAQPYRDLANALDAGGEALGTVAEETAKIAGLNAVTRDAQGNIQVERYPIVGPASQAYTRAVKFSALAQGEADAKDQDLALRTKYRDDPQSYLAAANAFKDKKVQQFSDAAGPEVGITLGKTIDATTTQTYLGLRNEFERLNLERADKRMTAGIQSAKDDAMALARDGDTSSPAFQQAIGKVSTLTQERVNNSRLAYPPDAAAYDLDHFQGELKAQGFLSHVDQIYKDTTANPDGTAKGGAQPALDYAKSILTDPSMKLTPEQRQQYFQKATAEVRANEALRRQDIAEARAAGQALAMASAYGAKIEPEDVEQVAGAFKAAGAPGEAARVYAMYARKPLNDEFGRLPLSDQTAQLQELRGMPKQKAAYDYLKGTYKLTDAQAAGVIGGLRGETASLDTTQVHDGGIGLGIAGWNGDRLAALKQYAADNKASPTDLKTQLDFAMHEMQTSEKASGDLLRAATTPEQAGNAMLGYLRPKDYNVPGAHPERAQYARAAFNAFGGGAQGASGDIVPDGMQVSPAGSLWLQANRATTVQKSARAAWGAVVADYDKSGQRPANAVVGQIVDAARATNDHDLLEGIAAKTQQIDAAERLSQRPLPEQNAILTEAKASGAQGLMSVGQGAVVKDLERKNAAITKGLDENPISTTVANFPDKLSTPAPLDLKNADNFAAGIAQRGRIAQFAQQNWQSGPVSALDKADLQQIQGVLDSPDPAVKAAVFQGLSALPEDVRNATLAKIGEKRPDFMVSAAAGSMMNSAPDVAQSIFRGQAAIKADKGFLPSGDKGDGTLFTEKLNTALPSAAFSLAARTDPNGPFAVAQGMIKARYADLSAQANDTSGKLNAGRLQTATDDVTGGVLSHNGAPLIAPQRGMSQVNFDRTISGINDNDLAGVSTLNGQPVTASYLRNNAQLESVGAGRYLVRLGRDAAHPVYAYQGANSEAPQKFVLDLRNRPMAAPDQHIGMAQAIGAGESGLGPQ